MKYNIFKNENENPVWITFSFIAIVIVLFHLGSLLLNHTLLSDDQAWYYSIGKGVYPWVISLRAVFLPFIHIPILLSMHQSPVLARFILLLFFAVPISCIFYYLFHYKFGVKHFPALIAAITANILPSHDLIINFIDGSYPLYGFLFALISLLLSFRYLECQTDGCKRWLYSSIIVYAFASQLMEQSSFMFPALAIAIAFYTKPNKKHFYLLVPFTLITCYRVYRTLANPWGDVNTIHKYDVAQIIARLKGSFYLASPLSSLTGNWYDVHSPAYPKSTAILILVIILLAGLALSLKNSQTFVDRENAFAYMSPKLHVTYVYLFCAAWFLTNSIVFIAMSKEYTTRYFYISSFGLSPLLIFSIYIILKSLFGQKRLPVVLVLIAVMLFTGYKKNVFAYKMFGEYNSKQRTLVEALADYRLAPHSQIVFVGLMGGLGTDNWLTSSGYLQQALHRKDVEGLLAKTTDSFYDPFNSNERDWQYRVKGLDLSRPIFLFKYGGGKTRQYEYALQWKKMLLPTGQGKVASAYSWNVIKFDKISGMGTVIKSGTGSKEYADYLNVLALSNINGEDILWGEGVFQEKTTAGETVRESFDRIDMATAAGIMRIPAKNSAANVQFGDMFQLVRSFVAEVPDTKEKMIVFLWTSLKQQQTGDYAVGCEIKNSSNNSIWSKKIGFLSKGTRLQAGDYMYGYAMIPQNVFARYTSQEHKFLAYFLLEDPGNWSNYPNMLLKTAGGEYNVFMDIKP